MSNETKNTSTKTMYFAAFVFTLVQIIQIITNIDYYFKSKHEAERRHEIAEKSLAADNLREFLNCKLGNVCEKLYPEAAATLLKAQQESGELPKKMK